MKYEVRCNIRYKGGAFEIVTDGAHVVAVEPGEESDEIVLVFEAERENATVQLLGPGGVKNVWTATPVE